MSDGLVVVTVVQTEAEAEALRGLLKSAGVDSMQRPTNQAAGAFDGWSPGGARELLVRAEDAELAREVLATQ